jgi:adenosine deaminase
MMPGDEASADVFISKFGPLREMYRSPEIIYRVAYEAVVDAALDNITYMELRFTPIALGRKMGYPLLEVAEWVIEAVNQAQAEYDIDVQLIISMNRHESVEIGDQHVDVARELMGRGIVAVDLAGLENRFPSHPFVPVFDKALEAGLDITIHAGEWAGAEIVSEVVNDMGAMRLGHGIRCIEDPNVLALVRDRGIPLEVCPTSNVQSGVTPMEETHPLRDLYGLGLITTLNTDDPSICGINLTDELFFAMKHLDFSLDDIKRQVLNAAHAAFLTEDKRMALIQSLEAEFNITPGG